MKTKMTAAAVLVLFLSAPALALTTQEILELKKAGVSDKTIQIMLKQEKGAKGGDPADRIGKREVKDKDGNTTILYSTGAATVEDDEKEQVENAWKMLQNMYIEKRITR
ncbi:MAG: hypothetical protein PHG91_00415 [Syntrophales bacterium]|nr:hypothetical protein [Syntrophales bacterium]MDD5231832.1 hypothetical protein [Syntrophales bacterium]MDD5531364.1 hypothetical protein [Syntrophales bacterium]HPL62851.1 hypothetical protein [Syntrophales bacterium]